MSTVPLLTPRQLVDLMKTSVVHVIDVRTPREYQEVHLSAARNVPLDALKVDQLPQDGNPIVFICKSGTRGRMACEKALTKYQNVFNVEGGTQACVNEGLDVVRGKTFMSLERQVRIAAGSLVLLGIGLSYLHPAFVFLSAFVGGGLVFSGVTDTCGMGMILAKMPWNRVPKNDTCTV
jgi:rhodanese-related sulfurtransferase